MSAGGINESVINIVVINGNAGTILVNKATIAVNVNKASSALINQPIINSIIINGLITDNNVHVTQTHILTVNDAVIGVVSTSPALVMVYTFIVDNANIALTAKKVFIEKGQGGHLFITITEPDTTVHRFSFGGVKA